MENSNNPINYQSYDFYNFLSDTAKLIADTQAHNIGLSIVAAQNAGVYTVTCGSCQDTEYHQLVSCRKK